LQQKLKVKEGKVIEIPSDLPMYTDYNSLSDSDLSGLSHPFTYQPEMGKIVGKHDGAHFYTIGQRKGLNIGGTARPLFVIALDVENNIIYTGQGEDHPGLYRKALFIRNDEIHWIRKDLIPGNGGLKVKSRIRYRQPLEDATIIPSPEGWYLKFDRPQKGITPGQFAAWYLDDELIGSGVIHY